MASQGDWRTADGEDRKEVNISQQKRMTKGPDVKDEESDSSILHRPPSAVRQSPAAHHPPSAIR